MPFAFAALLPPELTLPFQFTLQKLFAFEMEAPRSQKFDAGNQIRP